MKILFINQTFYPDPSATSQQLSDLTAELAGRGHHVTVITGDHGYDDPSVSFCLKEVYRGVEVRRIRYSRFGKKGKWGRLADALSFHVSLLARLTVTPRQDAVIALTSPPLVSFPALIFCLIRRMPLVQWLMDLNPDEAVAAGWLSASSPVTFLLRFAAGRTFRRSHALIALDDYMRRRLETEYGVLSSKIHVLPPWAHDDHIHPVDTGDNSFRRRYNPEQRFIVMYSGNHSPCHPLDTLLEAARMYKQDKGVEFFFIGGGTLTTRVTEFKTEHALSNIVQLPYQPMKTLAESLSAADLHVIVMGDAFAGIVHPSKIYGILAAGKPFVFVGPERSPIGDLVRETGLGRRVGQGDTGGLVAAIESARRLSSGEKAEICRRAVDLKNARYGRAVLLERMTQLTESIKPMQPRPDLV